MDAVSPSVAAPLAAGFASPVLDAQACFRGLMRSLAFPGRVSRFPALPETPQGWPPALAAAALTLLDADTPVWLDDAAQVEGAAAFVRFHTGAPILGAPDRARFAILLAPEAAPYDALPIGEDQYPDHSATMLIAVPSLEGGAAMRLSGPGIKTVEDIEPAGDLATFWNAWKQNGALYPLGFDAFLFAGDAVLGLPRSARAEPVSGR